MILRMKLNVREFQNQSALVKEADILIQMIDNTIQNTSSAPEKSFEHTVVVYSKSDLISKESRIDSNLYISTVTGEGIEECKAAIIQLLRKIVSISDSQSPDYG